MWSPDVVQQALRFAAERHAGQLVPGTRLPYLLHVTSVAAEVMWGLAELPLPSPELPVLCALLHDTVEDTETSPAEIAARFGDEVARGVVALSKDPALPKHERLDDSLRRIRACPREVWAVKLADRIVNLQPPPHDWTLEKRRAYREEAGRIHAALAEAHAPLAARLARRIEEYGSWL